MRSARTVALLALVLAGASLGAAAETPLAAESVATQRSGSAERIEAELGGTLVSALAVTPGELLLLVRPPAEPDGERHLLRFELGATPALARLAARVPGWTKTLAAADLGAGARLLVGGLGRVDDWGGLATPASAPQPLLAHPGLDLRSLAPGKLRRGVEGRLAAAEAGRLRVWTPDGAGGLALAREWRLPLGVEREETGLELRSPPVVVLPPGEGSAGVERFAAGPEVRGGRRLTVALLGPGDEASEAWVALPAVEKVEASWIVELDGEPALVVRSQGGAELDLFEAQRYRVFPLAADRTRAGRAPRLAVEVDTKRWHDTQVVAGDADGDGHDDLILARPEGMSGSDLVVEVYPGRGGVRFDRGARRTDLDDVPEDWLLVADLDGRGAPGLATVGAGRAELRTFAASGRRALERGALLAGELGAPAAATRREVEVVADGEGARSSRRESAGWSLLGVLPDPSAPVLLLLETAASGAQRLVALRAASAR